MIFYVQLHDVYHTDADLDGVYSKDEIDYDAVFNSTIIDTDGDGVNDYLDRDDEEIF